MIRKAVLNDLDMIMDIIKETVKEMNSHNNYQWDENYPKREEFFKDINDESLFVVDDEGEIAGFACINKTEPVEYNDLNWAVNEKAYVIHRLAISPKYRNKKVAYRLMKFSEELAKKHKIMHIRTDTYSLNTKAQGLFNKCDYNFVGEINFLGKEKTFYCFEKVL